MARLQVLSSIPQNQSNRMSQQHQTTLGSKQLNQKSLMKQERNRSRRSKSFSSLSSSSSSLESSGVLPSSRHNNKKKVSPSLSPDENKRKRERANMPFTEMFSPVRAIRAARAGMKRKRGGGPRTAASSSRGYTFRSATKPISVDNNSVETSSAGMRQIRGSRRTESRDASNSSLHRGMSAMVLTDVEPLASVARPNVSSRKVSGSGSVRSTRSRLVKQSREESEDEVIDDAEEDERLLLQAPSWQLHRLKKTKLLKLHIMLGTWQDGETVDLDLYNKHELVEGLVKARSNSTQSRVAPVQEGQGITSTDAVPPSSSSKRKLKRTSASTVQSQSSAYTDEEESASETEGNDAGGEETEAEPMKSAKRRQDVKMSRLYVRQGVSSPMVNRLRQVRSKKSIPNAAEVHFARDGMVKGSVSSSGLSSPLGQRLRTSRSIVFTASSPARTRLRTRNQSSSSSMRLSLPVNRSVAAQNVFTRRTEASSINQTPKDLRRKRINTKKSVAFGGKSGKRYECDSDDHQEWEDASPRSLRSSYAINPPRKAKLRAQEQLHHLHGLDQDALEDETGDMSIDETPTKANTKATSNSQALSMRDVKAAFSSDEEEEEEEGDDTIEWEEESHLSEHDVHASPSKMRRLRNGKIRMPMTDLVVAENENEEEEEELEVDEEEEEEEEDVDMEEADSTTDDVLESALVTPTTSSLSRLLRNQLVQLCDKHNVVVSKDATKAALIEALLQDHLNRNQPAPGSSKTEMPGSTGSTATTGPQSDGSTRTRRRGGGPTTRSSQRVVEDKPLLLRSHSNEVQLSKPPSPVPSNLGQANMGEDELNGLDLESLNLIDKEIPFSKLEKLEKIGSGGFKDVYIGKYQISKKTTKKVAIADIRDQLSEMDIKELGLLRDLKHENIVRFIGVCVPPLDMRLVPCMIVSELCTNGDLFDYIRNVEAPPDEEIFRIMLETARGIEYLHTRTPAIIHRDIKSTNVLVTRNKTAKINDFGLARVRNTKRSMIKSLVGTVNWQAVELWSPKPNYNEKVDVWSAAMTFWETLQWHQPEKKYPFQEMNEHQIYLDVGHKKLRPSTVSIRRNYGGEIVDLLDQMWDHNPKERLTMTQVCQRLEILIEMKKEASSSRVKAAAAATTTSKSR